MTGVAAFTPAALRSDAQGGAAQPLATGMAFEEVLRAAEQASERSFGFNELGLFGRGGATGAETSALPGPEPERARARDAGIAHADLPEPRGSHDAPPPGGEQHAQPRPGIPGRRVHADPLAARQAAAEARGAPTAPCRAGSEPAAPDPEQAARAAVPARRPRAAAHPAPARLAVMIEQGRVSLVGRDFTLTDEDRARLEGRLGEILESYGLGLRELVLNGMPGAANLSTREDG